MTRALLPLLGLALLLILLGLAWHGSLDRYAEGRAETLLTRALATYTLTRSLNGAISVAQGTEIAVQPVGIGVTISAGQILDPLNDLIERFSWLVLVACASLGTQLMLTQIFGSVACNLLLTAIAATGLVAGLWQGCPGRRLVLRVTALALLARFLIALVTLTAAGANALFLADREAASMAELESVSERVEQRNESVIENAVGDGANSAADNRGTAAQAADRPSMMERIGSFFGQQADALNVQQRLDALRQSAETAITEVINLIVIFVLQTIVFPLAALWLGWQLLQALSRAFLSPNQ